MNFLKKFGQTIASIAGIVMGVGPILGAAIPKTAPAIGVVTSELQQVAGVITTIEAAAAAASQPISGAEKLKMTTPLVAQTILQSAVLVGHKIADQALFTQGSKKIADGMADVLNSLHGDVVQVTQPQDVKAA